MSNAGQIVLGVVGGIVGFYAGGFTGAAYGFQLGLAVGTVVSPTQIPGTFGPRLTDNRTTTAQMGAPIVEVFGTDAVAGTVIWLGDIREISTTEEVGGKGGSESEQTTFTYTQSIAIGLCRGPKGSIRRIWENGKLVYDLRSQGADEEYQAYLDRINTSFIYRQTCTFYFGTEDQLPDPTIEAKEGVGQVPAYRELVYIVYHDRLLQDDQARRHPNFKFEVSDAVLGDNGYGSPLLLAMPFEGSITDESVYGHALDVSGGSIALDTTDFVCGESSIQGYDGGIEVIGDADTSLNPGASDFTIQTWIKANGGASLIIAEKQDFTSLYPFQIMLTGSGVTAVGAMQDDDVYGDGTTAYNCVAPIDITDGEWHHVALERFGSIFTLFIDGVGYPDQGNPGLDPPLDNGYAGELAGNDANMTIFAPLTGYDADNPAHMDEFYYAQSAVYRAQNFSPAPCADTALISLADIVEPICNRCELYDVDVIDLQTRYVNGYQLARIMDGRSAIAPLRQIGFFDAVDSGDVIRFVTRGKAAVRQLEQNDLGAHAFDSDVPPLVTTKKQQDVELPRQLFVQYRDPDRDYEVGEQPSPTRLITDAINDVYVDVAVAISATQAVRAAEVLWADMWAGRWSHGLQVDASQFELEITDCITVPVDGVYRRMRIVSADDSAVILRSLSLLRDDDGSYVSVAETVAPALTPNTMIIPTTTELLLLDLPPLRAVDNEPGLYAAARPTTVGLTWTGAQIFRSSNAGETFEEIATIVNGSTIGTLDAAFAAGDTTVFDDVTEITLTLDTGSLESRSDEDLFIGANSFAIGQNGRWEVLQFGVATLIGTRQWTISHLLRGRRGTEHVMGSSVAGDLCVLVSGAGIVRLPLINTDIGIDKTYRAVSLGMAFDSGIDQVYATTAEALKPFSPVSIAGERETGGDVLITWIRRDRLGEELPDGSEIAMSDPPESYEVDIYDADSPAQVIRTLESTQQDVTYTAEDQYSDFGEVGTQTVRVDVYQMSAVIGRGTPGTSMIDVADVPAIDYPVSSTEFDVSGTFDVSQEFDLRLVFTPRSGATVISENTITGAGKTTISEYADDIETLLDADMPASVTISRVGDAVTATTEAGTLSGSVTMHQIYASILERQAPLPITVGQSQIIIFDLFVPGEQPSVEAPDTSSAYNALGTATAQWQIHGGTYDIDASIGFGVSQATSYAVGIASTQRLTQIDGLRAAMDSLAILDPYLANVSLSMYGGTAQSRTAVAVVMLPGYYMPPTRDIPNFMRGSHPSGYEFATYEAQALIIDWPAGAKQKNSIYFTSEYGASGPLQTPQIGDEWTITLDSVDYTHTIDATDVSEYPYTDTAYTYLISQIDATADFGAASELLNKPGGGTFISRIIIERAVADTPFTITGSASFTLTIDVTNS